MLEVTHFTDPGCPWAYSASPAFATLHWRYGEQLRWRLVMIGLTESSEQYVLRGYTTAGSAQGYRAFARRFGMPFQYTPKSAPSATSPACRAVVAVRLAAPGLEEAALRELQLAQFTTVGRLEEPETIRGALSRVGGLDADAIVAAIHDRDVIAAYEADRALARTASGSPTEFQGKAASTDGPVRYTAPSLRFAAADGRTLEAGGFQPIEAYDVVIANLDPTLERRPAAVGAVEVLETLGHPLTTAEVAAVMTEHLGVPDFDRAENELIAACGEGRVEREPIGDGSLWRLRPMTWPAT